jgi:methylphosphotriester-DNA--protein-cysteine methyltransferase
MESREPQKKRWSYHDESNQCANPDSRPVFHRVKAGLSRAAFARNFSASVGEPPHSYLTRWRMGIAAQLLEETDLRLTEIAPRVGYRSEFSFSRAFKLARGVSPIQYRRAAQSRSFHGTLSRKA